MRSRRGSPTRRRFPIACFSPPAATPRSSPCAASAITCASAARVDDAIGEAFDKTAKLLGLGYPGGPLVEKEAARGDAERFALPRPMLGRHDADFSLSGLKTALRLEAEKIAPLSRPGRRRSVRLVPAGGGRRGDGPAARGLRMFRDRLGTPTALVCAGGVAANQAIRKVLHRVAFEVGTDAGGAAAGICAPTTAP